MLGEDEITVAGMGWVTVAGIRSLVWARDDGLKNCDCRGHGVPDQVGDDVFVEY